MTDSELSVKLCGVADEPMRSQESSSSSLYLEETIGSQNDSLTYNYHPDLEDSGSYKKLIPDLFLIAEGRPNRELQRRELEAELARLIQEIVLKSNQLGFAYPSINSRLRVLPLH